MKITEQCPVLDYSIVTVLQERNYAHAEASGQEGKKKFQMVGTEEVKVRRIQ